MADGLENLKYRFLNADGFPIPADERMHAFARKYAARFVKRYGGVPQYQHPFPNMWDYTFIIEFAGRLGEFSDGSQA
jgi:hypothetical protein